jgi:hypothetical protein
MLKMASVDIRTPLHTYPVPCAPRVASTAKHADAPRDLPGGAHIRRAGRAATPLHAIDPPWFTIQPVSCRNLRLPPDLPYLSRIFPLFRQRYGQDTERQRGGGPAGRPAGVLTETGIGNGGGPGGAGILTWSDSEVRYTTSHW